MDERSASASVLARMHGGPPVAPPVSSELTVAAPQVVEVAQPVWTDDQDVTWMGNIGVSQTGLVFPKREIAEEEWRAFYTVITKYKTAKQLMDGDWYAYGHDHFGYSYAQIAAAVGKAETTVESYASVCRNVPQLIRANSLTLAHYRKVSKLSPEAQVSALKEAVENRWSSAQLGQHLKGEKRRQIRSSSGVTTVRQKQYKIADRKVFNSAKKATPEIRLKLAAELRQLADELDHDVRD